MKNSHATVSSRNEYKRIAYYIIPVIVLIVLSFNNFLLFHTLIELFSIIVGYIIFVIALYSYKRSQNNFLILLGIAYGFIGGLDLIHTLSYKGMGIFVNGGADLPTKLWIIARYLESISITVSLWIIGSNNRKYNIKKVFYLFFVIFTALLLSLYFDIFPSCYIEGIGLTAFKKVSEYIISGILVCSLVLLRYNRDYFESSIYNMIKLAIIFTIISEILFTFYVSVYGISNIIGHLMKLFSFYLIFRAIVETGFQKPYSLLFRNLQEEQRKLKKSENRLNSIINSIPDMVIVTDKRGRYIDVWASRMEDLLAAPEELKDKDVDDVLPDNIADQFKKHIYLALNKDDIQILEYKLDIDNKEKYFEASFVSHYVEDKEKKEILIMIRNITDRRKSEEKIKYLSFHDQLTGLYNRRYFENEIDRLNNSRRLPVSIVIGDLDGLKYINDNYGHKMGDKYIKRAADLLNSVTRNEDIIARIGGDEFAIILPEITATSAQKLCERLHNKCNNFNKNCGLPKPMGISLGYATMNESGQNLDNTYHQADQNMYKDKGKRRKDLS